MATKGEMADKMSFESEEKTSTTAGEDEQDAMPETLKSSIAPDSTTDTSERSMVNERNESAKDTIQGSLEKRLAHKLAQQLCISVNEGHSPTFATSSKNNANTFVFRRSTQAPSTPQRSNTKTSNSEENSPSASQVSVGSAPYSFPAGLLQRHYDLTPVMRNTSINDANDAFASTLNGPPPPPPSPPKPRPAHPHGAASISPNQDQDLIGESLLLPPRNTNTSNGGPVLPPLSSLNRVSRRQSSSADDVLREANASMMMPLKGENSVAEDSTNLPPAFPLRKFYTFTDRQQYEQQQQHAQDHCNLFIDETDAAVFRVSGLTPYQPSRDHVLGDDDDGDCLGRPDPAELEQIFLPRTQAHAHATTHGESHANHRLLQNPIPLDERQWSIPSLRMANQLQQSSTCGSLTSLCDTDEESLLMRDCDDHSLSSRGSSLYFPETEMVDSDLMLETGDATANQDIPVSSHGNLHDGGGGPGCDVSLLLQARKNSVASSFLLSLQQQEEQRASSIHPEDAQQPPTPPPIVQVVDPNNATDKHRRRKQQKRAQRVYAWLQSVEADQNVLAEAASSKFLRQTMAASNTNTTGRILHPAPFLVPGVIHPTAVAHQQQSVEQQELQDEDKNDDDTIDDEEKEPIMLLQRQTSSPATLGTSE